MTTRYRWGALGLVLVLATALTATFVVRAVGQEHRAKVPTAATRLDQALDLGTVLDAPHIVFRSTAPGPTFGKLAAVPLAHPGGQRSVSNLSCDRVFATSTDAACMVAHQGALASYHLDLLNNRMIPLAQRPLNGIPSRARMSVDGSLIGNTVFVAGHSYATIGFSTETTIYNQVTKQDYGNLEKTFAIQVDPRRNHAPDLNIWGVTFPNTPNPTTFYATVAAGGLTWLAKGDLTTKTLTAVHTDAECPSISPDGKIVVYKKRAGSLINWRYHGLDLATGKEWALPETRSVDDQVEWLDDSHVLYGLARGGSLQTDVWESDIRTGKPRLLIPYASSPAVVR